jgi:hypothetical protein
MSFEYAIVLFASRADWTKITPKITPAREVIRPHARRERDCPMEVAC